MTEQERQSIKTQALTMIQAKMTNDLESFRDAIAVYCSRVIDSVIDAAIEKPAAHGTVQSIPTDQPSVKESAS